MEDARIGPAGLEDPQVMDGVYRKYMPRVFHFLCGKVSDPAQAEDLTSTVFLKVLERGGSYDPEKAPLPVWIFSITNHTLTDYYRTRRVHADVDDYAESGLCRTDGGMDGVLCGVRDILDALMEDCLTEREALVLRLRYFEALGNRELAARIGLNENTVSTLHRRALQKLRARLELDGFSLADLL